LGAVSLAASALNLRASDSNTQGGYMKRTLVSALLTSAGLSAATFGGYVHDSNGAAIADAKVSIFSPDTSAKQEAVTGADGKFSFSGSTGGQYILRVEKAGFASIFREFDVKADGKMDREFTMASEGGALVPDKSIGPSEDQPKRIRVGGEVAQNNLIKKVQPVYPLAAKKAGTQGIVEIEATISKDGLPVDLRVTSSPSDELSESALEAVGQWQYRPTLLNGQPIEIVTTVVVNYTLAR
jgi:TonB family protein